jgi:Amt family ammonium transporter
VLSGDPATTSLVLVTTSLAAAAGGFGAFILSTLLYKNFDLTMFLNGILGGLVGITAGADLMSPNEAVLIGLIAGAIIVGAVALIDRLRLDDPVGAVAVHLGTGIFGTLAVGIFGDKAGINQFLYQLAGVVIVGAFCALTAFIILYTIKKTMGIRVSKEEELEGLDLHEHGMDAYADFRLNQH